jgi:hypothetical protein|tara:strand:- start:2719 stop:3303 length:585 start_codon:yes stop_codon:yes gene_type:complete
MAEKITLFKQEYLVGFLNEDLLGLSAMIMNNYHSNKFMAEDDDHIRKEDVRIDFNSQVQRIASSLEREWFDAFGTEIELCWNTSSTEDPNTAFWSVVHSKNESTNLHTHESEDNYIDGAHVSAAYYVQVPPRSGDLVFQYKRNPYITDQTTIVAEPNKFVMFDSTISHYVTKNHTNEKRIVISMNFKIKQTEED